MEIKKCKKCGRVLPENYEYTLCENCRNKKANMIKKVGSTVGAAAMAVIVIGAALLGGGNGSDKK